MHKWSSSHAGLRLYLALLLALVLSAPQLGRGENERFAFRVCASGCDYDQVAAAVAEASDNDVVMIEGTLLDQESVDVTLPLTITGQNAEVQRSSDMSRPWLSVHNRVQLSGNISITGSVVTDPDIAIYVASGAVLTQTQQLEIFTAGVGVQVDVGGQFEQRGDVEIDLCGTGVDVKGVWEQYGNTLITRYKQGVSVINGTWTQNGPISAAPPYGFVSSGGVEVIGSTWTQNGPAAIASLAADGLVVESTKWLQRAPVSVRSIDGSEAAGIRFTGSAALWWQYDNVTIAVEQGSLTLETPTPLVCGGGSWVKYGGVLSITPTESDKPNTCLPTPSVTNSSAPSPGSATAVSEQPILRFNATANSLRIVPKADKAVVEAAAVDLALASVVEVADNGTYLRTGSLRFGVWSVLDLNKTDLAASQAFTYSSPISFDQESGAIGSQGRVELQVFLFDVATNVSIGDMAAFTVLPSFTKISLAISSWPWVFNNSASRLEVRLGVSPPFSGVVQPSPSVSPSPAAAAATVERSADDSGDGTATLTLTGQASSDGKRSLSTVVRFVSVVELDGELVQPSSLAGMEDLPVKFGADVEQSAIVLSFRHFSSSLSYDPDLSVLVGRRGDDGSSDDSAWIIGVSVAVPVAVAGVVIVVAVLLAVTTTAKKRRMRELHARLAKARQNSDL